MDDDLPPRPSAERGDDRGLVVHVPDDARELDRDVRAWRREERRALRRRALSRIFGRFRPAGVSATARVVATVVTLVGVFALAAWFSLTSRNTGRPLATSLPLATSSATPGQAGALLPAATLQTANGTAPARSLRPAVVTLVDSGCNCAAALRGVAAEAAAEGVPLYLVAPPSGAAEAATLAASVHAPDVVVLIDTDGVLATTYDPSGLTVIPVHADGIAGDAIRGVTNTTQLGPALTDLGRRGAAETG
jgi:hypothetical protein